MAKVKSFKGNRPVGDRWSSASRIETDESGAWEVWFHKANAEQGYINFKIIADGRAKAKANYWTACGPRGATRTRDLMIMKENNPDLFLKVIDCMDQVYREELGQ